MPALTLSPEAVSVAESTGGAGQAFTVTLNDASSETVSVAYATADGTAAADADYTATAATLTFEPGGQPTQTFSVPILQDTLDEDDETFTVTLSSAVNATAGPPATVTITDDDDAPALTLSGPGAAAVEGTETSLVFTVTLAPASGREVTVGYATLDGTATAPGDYTAAAANATLTFGPGETSKSVTVPIVDDDLDEPEETFAVVLGQPQGATLSVSEAPGTIADNDDEPALSVADATAAEDAGPVRFTVTLAPASGHEVTVGYATSDGTAEAPADYTAEAGSTLTFAPGETTKTIEVAVVDDGADEADEEFTLTLSGPVRAGFAGGGSTVAATGTITDDDVLAVEVSFGAAEYTASEGGSAATVTVQLNVDPEREVTIPLTVTNAGGASDGDHSGAPTELVFRAGEALFQTFEVEAVDDAIDDDGESVVLGFGPALPEGVTAVAPEAATVTLTDDDARGVQASPTLLSVNENESTSYTVVLESAPTEDVTVTVTGSDGTDLTSPSEDQVLVFTAENWSTPQMVTVTAADDTDVLADAPVELTHTVAGGDYGANSVAGPVVTVTIVENDTATLSAMDATADESAGYVEFTVTLSEASSAAVTVDYATSDDTAVAPDDYTATSGTLTFTVPETSRTIQVPVVDDTVDEAEEETFTLTLSEVVQAGLAGGADTLAVTGTITDDDDPAVAVSFGAEMYTAAEGGTPVTVTVRLDKDPERAVVVPLTATPGNGAVAADYSASATEVTFTAGGALSRTFALTAEDDDVDDDGETVELGFGTLPARVAVGGTATSTVTLTDEDERGVVVSETELTLAEGESGSYTVVLTSEPAGSVTVTVGGSSNTHLTVSPSTVLVFTALTWDVPQTVTVTAAADADAVVPEAVELTHTVAGGDYAGEAAGSVTVVTTELTVPELTLSPSAASVSESVGAGGQAFTVTLSVASSETVTVGYATADGTAAAGDDYTSTSGTLTLSPGGSLSQTFSVPILGDALDEDDETFTVSLGSPLHATAGSSSAVVTITDDDATPVVRVEDVTVSESVGTLTFTVTLDAESAQAVTVSYATSDGTATSPADYAATSGVLAFAAGQMSRTVDVQIVDDGADEDEAEDFTLTLSSPGNALFPGDAATLAATGTITDDDDPAVEVSFGAAAYTAAEGGSAATVTVSVDVDPERAVTVRLTRTNEAGATDGDYSGVPAEVVFTAGAALFRTFGVTATDDDVDDDGERVVLGFGMPLPAGVTATGATTATVTLVDDDERGVRSSQTAVSVDEDSSTSYTVVLTSEPTAAVTVTVSGTSGTDLTAPAEGLVLTFTPSDWNVAQTVTVTAGDDTDVLADAVVELSHAVSGGDYVSNAVTGPVVTVTIVENDTATLSAMDATADESAGYVEFTVTLSEASSAAVTVDYATSDDTAVAPDDYTATSGTLTFTVPETSRTIQVPVVDDTVDEAEEETFTLTLSEVVQAGLAGGADTLAVTGTITDDDDPAVAVSFGAEMYTAAEGGTPVTVTVRLDKDPERAVVVPLTATPGNGAVAADYSVSATEVTFTAGGALSQTLTLTAVDDAIDDDDETVALGFGTLPARVAAATPESATVTITDDDARAVTVSETERTIPEGESDSYTVVLGSEPTATVTVTVNGSDGTHLTAPAEGQVLTFTAETWSVPQTVTVTAPADADAVVPPAVTLTHAVTGGDYAGEAAGSVTVRTTELTVPELTLSPSAATVSESVGGAGQMFTVTLNVASSETVTVAYATSDGTAASGADYTAASGTLSFAAGGALTQTFSVPILGDALDEDDETFTVSLSDPVQATVASGAATVTITDDDALPAVSLPSGFVIANEGDGELTVPVSLSAASGREVRVNYASSDLSGSSAATAGEDYGAVNGTLRFAAGTTTQTFRVSITDDTLDEGGFEQFRLTLSDPVNAVLGAVDEKLTRINDDDAEPTLDLSPTAVEVEEGSAVTFTAQLSAASSLPVNLTWETSNGTAVAPGDYMSSNGRVPLQIPAGETSRTFLVSTTDDGLDEEDTETFGVRIRPSNLLAFNARMGADRTTVSIVDNDEPPALRVADVAAREDTGSLVFTVRLDAPSAKTVTVGYAVAAGTATAGVDYTAVPAGTLTFEARTTEQSFSVPIIDDAVHEPDETLTATLSGATNATLADADATGTITDDEGAPTVSLVLTPPSIGENGGISTLTATLSSASSEAVTVTVSAMAVSPAVAGDFTQNGTTLTFAAGETTSTGTVTLTAVNNAVDEPNKTIRVSGSVTGGLGVSAPSSQDLTITDDEATPSVTLVLTPSMIDENGGISTLTATLSGALSEAVTVTVSAMAVSPAVSGDFMQSGTALTFAAGETTSTGTVTLTAVNNDVDAPDKTVRVSGSVTGGLGVSAPASQDLTITDDEATPSVTLVLTPSMIDENGGMSTVTATLSGASSAAVTVTVSAMAVSPAVSGDFMQSGTALTFAAGETTSTGMVTLTAENNAVDEPNKTIRVSGSVTGGLGVSAPSSQDLTITDDEGAPTVSLVLMPTLVDENGGMSTVTATLSGASSAAVTVTVLATAVSPAVAGDFTQSGTTLTIAAGQTTSTGTVTIAAVNNAMDAPDKTVRVTGSVTGGLGVSSPAPQDLTITDDEGAPTVALVLSPTTIGENGGVSTVTATLTGASSEAVTVMVTAGPVSPAVVADFTQSGTTLTIAVGQTTSTGMVTLTAVNNDEDAPDKVVRVTGSVTGGLGVSSPSSQDLTITDDEGAPTVALVLTPPTIGENGGMSTVTATLTGASSETVTVMVTAAPVSPAVADDFTQSGTTLTIAAGETTSTGTVTLRAVNNDLDAPNKMVRMTGSVTGGHGVSAPSPHELTITDDEGGADGGAGAESDVDRRGRRRQHGDGDADRGVERGGDGDGVGDAGIPGGSGQLHAERYDADDCGRGPDEYGDGDDLGGGQRRGLAEQDDSGDGFCDRRQRGVGAGVAGPDDHGRRGRSDGGVGADADRDRGERRREHGDGDAERGVERGGDGDGVCDGGVSGGCG